MLKYLNPLYLYSLWLAYLYVPEQPFGIECKSTGPQERGRSQVTDRITAELARDDLVDQSESTF